MNKRNKLLAYASDFSSYLLGNAEGIRNIILFGSAARGDIDKESDVDIFIDIMKPSKKKEEEIEHILDSFYKERGNIWKLKGTDIDISLFIGNLESREWKSLRRSIMTDGVTLYGKFTSRPEKLEHYIILVYPPIMNAKKRVNLYRRLFGYSLGKKKYNGLISDGGIKLGAGSFMIPVSEYSAVKKIFRDAKVTPRVIEVWKD